MAAIGSISVHDSDTLDEETLQFTQARFPIDLNLPPADASLLEDAWKAIRREYRDSAKWKRLWCRKVSVGIQREAEMIVGDQAVVGKPGTWIQMVPNSAQHQRNDFIGHAADAAEVIGNENHG